MVRPVTLVSGDKEYILEFNRASALRAESAGFSPDDLQSGKRVMTGVTELFYYSFLMHQPDFTKGEAESIIDEMGGVPTAVLERLAELYAVPYNTLIQTEESSKNSKWAVRL